MSDSRKMLTDMAESLFSSLGQTDFAIALPQLQEAGFDSLLISEAKGGFGGDWGDAYAVMRLAGREALAAPLAESIIAHSLLAAAKLTAPPGLLGIAAPGQRVPYGRHTSAVVSVDQGRLKLFTTDACKWDEALSPAGEPADGVTFTGTPIAEGACSADLMELGAFARVAQAAGALESAFTLTLDHVNMRVQFGKPLGRFQAVQQAMAELSVETAAIDAAGQSMATALDLGDAEFEIAAAKLRANIAIERSFPIAHRLHGAIGFTMEYALQRYTRRLMGWRSEFGNDTYWSERLGKLVSAKGGAALWEDITARSDRIAPAG